MRTVAELIKEGVAGRRVLVRSDLNVPLAGERITDDGRIRASLPVLRALSDAGARVVVCAHLGRPKGAPEPRYSLRPVADRLQELLDRPVRFATDTVGAAARAAVAEMADGDVTLCENVRFEPGETSRDDAVRGELARQYAALADAFVQDAFGAVHRRHASVYDVARLLPNYAGDLVLREVEVLRGLASGPVPPYVVVLGGSKVSDKLGVIEALLPKVDRLLVGGGMCFTFLAAQGHPVGGSLLESDLVATCRGLLERAGDRLVLPTDVVVAAEVSAGATTRTVPADAIPEGDKGLDIGPQTVARFAAEVAHAGTVFWNGPMGVFEVAPFAAGTKGVADAVAACPGMTVVGGGDSAAAVRQLGVDEAAFGHISTGGGASLEFLEGKSLPGISVLED
ncbi:MAG: phosphoglycerate kinase [Actinobacteria bacterium]|nr:phosphoglycerate kinase [Actinomycetota bacterium]